MVSQLEPHRCDPPNLCIGGCRWHSVHTMPDGTQFTGDSSTLAGHICRETRWPSCTHSVIPTRRELLRNPSGSFAFYVIGFGARVTGMLVVAAHAFLNGVGFQLSSHACGYEDMAHPHCFFQPVSACGATASHVCSGCALPSVVANRSSTGSDWTLGRTLSIMHVQRLCHHLVGAEEACKQSQRWGEHEAPATGALLAWRALAALVLRLQPEMEVRVTALLAQRFPNMADGARPFGAVHIRRRDKTALEWWGREARPIDTCVFAERLAWLAAKDGRDGAMPVFVATDDHRTVDEFAQCNAAVRHSWTVHSWPGEPARGVNTSVVVRLWSEMQLLRRATWAVGTLSSNIGRLVQLLRSQPPATFWSVDTNQQAVIPPDRRFLFHLNQTDKAELRAQRRVRAALAKTAALAIRRRDSNLRRPPPWASVLKGHDANR